MRVVAGIGAALTLAATGSAYAGSSSTTVTIAVGSAGTRQLDVLDLSGNPLTNLALQANTPAPFRVRVTDNAISDLTAPNSGFSVSAVLNNLYKQTGASSYDYTKSIPSSDVSISYNPLTAFGVSLDDLPQISLSGVIPSCTQMVTDGILANTDLTTTALSLCTLLTNNGGTATITNLDVKGALKSVTPTVTNLLDLPFQITGNESGAFTNPDFANGIGANDPAKTGTTPTPRQVMQGAPNLTATLQSEIQSAIGALPAALTSPTGSGADTTLSDVLGALSGSANSTLAQLGSALGSLSQSEQVNLINQYLSGSLVGPVLADVSNVAGTYNAFPMLTAAPGGTTPAGTYAGTMTITLVQQ